MKQLLLPRSDVVHSIYPEYLQVILAGSEQNTPIILRPAPCARYRPLSVKFAPLPNMKIQVCNWNAFSAVQKIDLGAADFSDETRSVSVPRQSLLHCSSSSTLPTQQHPRQSLHRLWLQGYQLHGKALLSGRHQAVCQFGKDIKVYIISGFIWYSSNTRDIQTKPKYPVDSFRSRYDYYDTKKFNGDYLYPESTEVSLSVFQISFDFYFFLLKVLGNWRHYNLSSQTLNERNQRSNSPLVTRELTRYGNKTPGVK